jgi:hypothetical protein
LIANFVAQIGQPAGFAVVTDVLEALLVVLPKKVNEGNRGLIANRDKGALVTGVYTKTLVLLARCIVFSSHWQGEENDATVREFKWEYSNLLDRIRPPAAQIDRIADSLARPVSGPYILVGRNKKSAKVKQAAQVSDSEDAESPNSLSVHHSAQLKRLSELPDKALAEAFDAVVSDMNSAFLNTSDSSLSGECRAQTMWKMVHDILPLITRLMEIMKQHELTAASSTAWAELTLRSAM